MSELFARTNDIPDINRTKIKFYFVYLMTRKKTKAVMKAKLETIHNLAVIVATCSLNAAVSGVGLFLLSVSIESRTTQIISG